MLLGYKASNILTKLQNRNITKNYDGIKELVFK